MASYSDSNFNSDHYSNARPTYQLEFIEYINDLHNSTTSNVNEIAVDIGCGTGQVAFLLAKFFEKTIGIDPSETMITKCNKLLLSNKKYPNQLCFKKCFAEDLLPIGISNNSIDLVTAAECFHWFNHELFFKEMARILKNGGTLAYWCYLDPIILKNKTTGKNIDLEKYMQLYNKYTFDDDRYFGPYWEQPGRNTIRMSFSNIEIPLDLFEPIEIKECDFLNNTTNTPLSPLTIGVEWNLTDYQNYVTSWSAYHRYDKPDRNQVLKKFIDELIQTFDIKPNDKLDVVWNTKYYILKKK